MKLISKNAQQYPICIKTIKIVFIGLAGILSGCTLSIVQAHTEGQATDVVDDTQTASPDVKADVKIPPVNVRERPKVEVI